jgi:hypothetical protein
LLFAHHHSKFLTWKHLFAERRFCLRCRSATKVFLLFTKAIALRAPARPG